MYKRDCEPCVVANASVVVTYPSLRNFNEILPSVSRSDMEIAFVVLESYKDQLQGRESIHLRPIQR
jgi:hypothetical protein